MKLNEDISISETPQPHESDTSYSFDYTFVNTTARIALYDDLKSAPRIITIEPSSTAEYIETLASSTYEQAKIAGGSIPYTVIREVSENFIHAQFSEIVISILDNGNTIRFSDQGPGIRSKEQVKKPGFTSAIEPMKKYIRGVGSGLPIVKEYLDFSNGSITIEDNLDKGAIITIKLTTEDNKPESTYSSLTPPLSDREKMALLLFAHEGALGVTDISQIADIPQSSAYFVLSRLEEYGLVEKTAGRKRILTDFGFKISNTLE
ncbi:MAG: ATP-binding protein [Raoultibacter sp.]|jgi:uncharacterized membrane protein